MTPNLKSFIEENIELIEKRRWQGLYSLAKATIPYQIGNLTYNLMQAGIYPLEDLREVLPNMFDSAELLESIEIPNNIESVGKHAFKDCYQLKDLILPESINFIDVTAFKGCYTLSYIEYKGTATEFMNTIKPTTDMFWDCATGTIKCSDKYIFIDFDGKISIEESV